jgi:hypothetical protein
MSKKKGARRLDGFASVVVRPGQSAVTIRLGAIEIEVRDPSTVDADWLVEVVRKLRVWA